MEPIFIDRSASVALYQQVSDHIHQLIIRGTLSEGDELPAEGDLAKHYEVSRSVIRQALANLVAQGFIETQKGRPARIIATFRPRSSRDISRAGGLAEELQKQGKDLVTTALSITLGPPPVSLRDNLFLQDCWEIHRLRMVEGEPIMYVINWVPQNLLPSLTLEDVEHHSLHALIKETGVDLEGGKRQVSAVAVEDTIAENLGISPGSPVLQIVGETRTTLNNIAECFQLWHHPSFDLEINASTDQTPARGQLEKIEQALDDLQEAISGIFPHRPALIERKDNPTGLQN